MKVLLPITYAGPIDYFALLVQNEVTIEKFESFVKQSYRSRCEIAGPNGLHQLVIPIAHTDERRQIENTQIAYYDNWQKVHWKSMEAAYRSSPFFEFYEDEFAEFYNQNIPSIYDFCDKLTIQILKWLKHDGMPSYTNAYEVDGDFEDYRGMFNPKHYKQLFIQPSYQQTFPSKEGVENLSILDLLFNLGPEAKGYLLGLKRI